MCAVRKPKAAARTVVDDLRVEGLDCRLAHGGGGLLATEAKLGELAADII
jgi:hypothetical protein